MSGQQIPPWLQNKMVNLQRSQQNLQAIMTQLQNLDMEQKETDNTLEELRKVSEDETVYKLTGHLFIRRPKEDVISGLEENLALAKTRRAILTKQEARLKESITEQQAGINDALRGKPGP